MITRQKLKPGQKGTDPDVKMWFIRFGKIKGTDLETHAPRTKVGMTETRLQL